MLSTFRALKKLITIAWNAVTWWPGYAALCTLTLSASLAQVSATPTPLPQPDPCATRPEYRHFDFWIGEWDVTDKGKKIATSTIERGVGGCVIFENYAQLDGYTGKSINFFDAVVGKWRQTWVDSRGNVSEFVVEFTDGAMRFEGETHIASAGAKVLRRMILWSEGPDRVRQYSERSSDGGKTWTIGFDYIYVRQQ
jgi:hypothetical protein